MTFPAADIVRSFAAKPRTHDYTRAAWGHSYEVMSVEDHGRRLGLAGWGPMLGPMIRPGDYLILRGEQAGTSTRYQVESITYQTDPDDQWFADATFAPREAAVQ